MVLIVLCLGLLSSQIPTSYVVAIGSWPSPGFEMHAILA